MALLGLASTILRTHVFFKKKEFFFLFSKPVSKYSSATIKWLVSKVLNNLKEVSNHERMYWSWRFLEISSRLMSIIGSLVSLCGLTRNLDCPNRGTPRESEDTKGHEKKSTFLWFGSLLKITDASMWNMVKFISNCSIVHSFHCTRVNVFVAM